MSDTPNTAEPKKKKNFLVIYVLSLLAIALALLMFSFLQNRRASEQISDLQNEHSIFSTSALQSINDLRDELGELKDQNAALIAEQTKLADTNSHLTAENDKLRDQLTEARDDLAAKRIELYDANQYKNSLVGIFEQMETDGVAELMRDENGNIVNVSIGAEYITQ